MSKLTPQEYSLLNDKEKEEYKSKLFSALLRKGAYYPSSFTLSVNWRYFTFNLIKATWRKKFIFIKNADGYYDNQPLGKKSRKVLMSESEELSIIKKLDNMPLRFD